MTLTTVNPALLDTQAQYTGFKNRIINGAMVIDQRNAGASVTPTANAYTLDRWYFYVSQASKLTSQQNAGAVTPPVGFGNYLGVTSSSAYSIVAGDNFIVAQRVEGFNTSDFAWGTANAVTVTLSFWVRSSLTGTFGGSIQNGSQARSYPFSYSISSANTWEQKSVTIAGDTSGTWVGATNGTGLILNFGLGVGSNQTGGASSWQAGNLTSATGAVSVVGTSGATFYITGVQLEKGSTATSFDYRPYGTELGLCQRYFVRVTGRNLGYVRNDGQFNSFFTLPTLMRTDQPSGTFNVNGLFTNFAVAVASSPSSFSITSESKATTRGWLYITCQLGSYSAHTWIPSWEGFSFDASSEL